VLVILDVIINSDVTFLLLIFDDDIFDDPNVLDKSAVTVPAFADRSSVARIVLDDKLHDSILDE